MKNSSITIPQKYDIKFICLLFFGCFLRLFYIGNIPGNTALYSDEIFSGYEAWSMLHYGYDYLGYHFPVYLPCWGSGMSVMQALCQMPFIGIFGLNSFALRLPAAILGCITLYAFYYICKEIKDKNFAYFATFILCIMPWHIMQSRWGLDCNYFAGFITISIALFIKSTHNKKFLPLAFCFLGLTLYTYALPWIVMPIFVLGVLVYFLMNKNIVIDRYLILSVAILILLAFPLFLFLLVNYDVIPEIRTSVISIPRLSKFRNGELITSVKSLLKNFYNSFLLFVSQDDGRVSDVTPLFGLYYKFSNPFILIGLVKCIIDIHEAFKKKVADFSFIIFLLFICSVILSATTEIYFSRINIIHIPMTYFCAYGLWSIIDILKHHSKEIVIITYSLACIIFIIYYFTYHDDAVAEAYDDGCKQALSYVSEITEPDSQAEVHLLSGVFFTHVIFYTEYPTDRFMQDVDYADLEVTGGNMIPRKFGKYDLTHYVEGAPLTDPVKGDIYICSHSDKESVKYLEKNNMNIKHFSTILVGVAE